MLIHVTNLSPEISLQDLKGIFGEFGVVVSASIEQERMPGGGSMRIGFVEMPHRDEGLSAVKSLNGRELKGERVTAEEINEREKAMEMQRKE